MRETAGSAAAPATRCRNCRRGSFIFEPPSRFTSFGHPSARLSIAISPNRTLWNIHRQSASLVLDVGCFDHLAPLLGLGGNELCKVAGRARKSSATEFGQPRLDLGIGKAGVDLGVELVDDLSRRVPGRADPIPLARLEARQEFSHSWDARQRLRARRARYRQ